MSNGLELVLNGAVSSVEVGWLLKHRWWSW